MFKAYVILAHKNPAQLFRLVSALNDNASFFFVHIDKSVNEEEFTSLDFKTGNIQFIKREYSTWGSFKIVRAVLNGLYAVKAAACRFNQVILLSGQDYPLRSNEYISRFAESNADKTFIEYFDLPNHGKWQPDGGMYRVNKYFIGLRPAELVVSRTLNLFSRLLPVLKRRPYNDMKPYAGSMWWMMSMTAVNYILEFVEKNPGYTAFHRYTFAPDEVFFHMILLNAQDSTITDNIVNADMRYIQWQNIAASHPKIIDAQAIPAMIRSNALFARKFDEEKEPHILELIDKQRLQPQ